MRAEHDCPKLESDETGNCSLGLGITRWSGVSPMLQSSGRRAAVVRYWVF